VGAHWRHLVAVAGTVYAGLALLGLLLIVLLGLAGLFCAFLLLFAGVYWVQGPIAKAIEDVRDGRADLTVRGTLRAVRPRVNKLSLAGVTAALGIYVGLLLLVIPGLVLLARWSVLAPVTVLEGKGVFGGLRRSWQLVAGSTLRVLSMVALGVAVVVAGYVGAVSVAELVSPSLGDWQILLVLAILCAAMSVSAGFAAVLWTVLYFHLLDRRNP
jgi:hypothetical protein